MKTVKDKYLVVGADFAGFPLKEILVNTKVYVATFVRMIVIPGAVCLALHALGTSKEIMTLALIFFGTPLGLNSIVYPETYGGDVKTGASMASVSAMPAASFAIWISRADIFSPLKISYSTGTTNRVISVA